jgi:hypothetical protein
MNHQLQMSDHQSGHVMFVPLCLDFGKQEIRAEREDCVLEDGPLLHLQLRFYLPFWFVYY